MLNFIVSRENKIHFWDYFTNLFHIVSNLLRGATRINYSGIFVKKSEIILLIMDLDGQLGG